MDNAKGTEDHFLSLIRNADPNAEVTLCRMACAKADKDLEQPKYFRDPAHPLHLLSDDYVDWHDVIGKEEFDLVIVTGINRGKLTYQELEEEYPLFWNETQELLEAIETTTNSGQTGHGLLVCWTAMAAAKIRSGVEKQIYDTKFYGVFDHHVTSTTHPLVRGWSDGSVKIPHARYSYLDQNELENAIEADGGEIILNGPDGPAIWTLNSRAITCLINHPEYGQSTLENEYIRDRGFFRKETQNDQADIPRPQNYELGSTGTAQDFATLKSVICPAFYKNVIDLAKNRKNSEQAPLEYTAEVAMPVRVHQFPA